MSDTDEKPTPLDDARRQLYAPVPREETAYHLWRQFDPALAKRLSEFFVGGLYRREVLVAGTATAFICSSSHLQFRC